MKAQQHTTRVEFGRAADLVSGSRPATADGAQAWPRLPGYEILGELGRGGMAIVYRARDLDLRRVVALKVVLGGALASGSVRQRMRREAEAVARLRHPNVVQIHDIEDYQGCLYISLECVEGSSLAERLASRPLPPREAARLVTALAGGVQAAHDAGIIHRDLKPANVLLDRDGTPKVTDFGLAKCRDEDQSLTATGIAAGTPCYMAPEQVTRADHEIGPATDVYGLGSILYECLTGRPPFEAPTTLETMRQVTDEEVVPVRRLQGSVPPELEAICLKCLEKSPARRYPSARELAADLERFLAGAPVVARPASLFSQGWKWARRNPVVPLLAGSLGLMTVVAVSMMAWSTYDAANFTSRMRERELHLHGLRGTLMYLRESQTRFTELAAATGDPVWEPRHRAAADEAARARADANRLAPEAEELPAFLAAGEKIDAIEAEVFRLVASGQQAAARDRVAGAEYAAALDRYSAGIAAFADHIDRSADEDMRQLHAEAVWSLACATMVLVIIAGASVTVWLYYLRPRWRSPIPPNRQPHAAPRPSMPVANLDRRGRVTTPMIAARPAR